MASSSERLSLPIDAEIPEILRQLDEEPYRLVLQSPPGSGKSTRLPPALIHHLPGRVCLLQPRRSATLLLARRIAAEEGWTLGKEIGYAMRFAHEFLQSTRLLVATHGSFLQMLVHDPFLEGISCVVLDEFHERTLDLDLISGLLLQTQKEVRPDLKIVWMSATLSLDEVADKLKAKRRQLEGRSYPLEIHYLPPKKKSQRPIDDLEGVLKESLNSIYSQDPKARTLVFLPGKGEIDAVSRQLSSMNMKISKLHGSLDLADQENILRSQSPAEIILSTNIAESSVTLQNVNYVVDSGLVKLLDLDPSSGQEFLRIERLSRDSADQRAGRAARTAPGRCYRLWSEDEQRFLRATQRPEILRRSLETVILRMLDAGFSNYKNFPWLSEPDPQALFRAERALGRLGLLTDEKILSPLGKRILTWPLPIRWALFIEIIARDSPADLEVALRLTTSLGGEGTSIREADVAEGLDRILKTEFSTQAEKQIHADLVKRAERLGYYKKSSDFSQSKSRGIVRALLAAFPEKLCRRRDGADKEALMVSRRGVVWRDSGPQSKFFLALSLQFRPEHSDSFLQAWIELNESDLDVSADWIEEHYLTEEKDGKMRFFKQRCFLDLPLAMPQPLKVTATDEIKILKDLVATAWKEVLENNSSLQQWRRRWMIAFPREVFPLENWAFLEAALRREPGKFLERKFLESYDFSSVAAEIFNYASLSKLERLAPTHLEVFNGRMRRLSYLADGNVDVEVILQDLLGQTRHPVVGQERIPLRIHLLSPARRPIQVTKDLPGFWQTSYPEIRKELRGRYPKHPWPEDPRERPPPKKKR